MSRFVLGAAAMLMPLIAACASGDRSVYVMRHLQKVQGSDPVLSAEGAANAAILAERLGKARIKAIFATRTKRAMLTGAPLAVRLGIAITSYDPANPEALVEAAAAVRGPVLVIGHSNTVPELVERFGGARPPAMSEADYGTIFVVEPGSAQVRQIRIDRDAPAN